MALRAACLPVANMVLREADPGRAGRNVDWVVLLELMLPASACMYVCMASEQDVHAVVFHVFRYIPVFRFFDISPRLLFASP